MQFTRRHLVVSSLHKPLLRPTVPNTVLPCHAKRTSTHHRRQRISNVCVAITTNQRWLEIAHARTLQQPRNGRPNNDPIRQTFSCIWKSKPYLFLLKVSILSHRQRRILCCNQKTCQILIDYVHYTQHPKTIVVCLSPHPCGLVLIRRCCLSHAEHFKEMLSISAAFKTLLSYTGVRTISHV